ncbi:MAG: DedA family protein [Deltaproteobacteria bacterium]|nr:DedA family protein [Deltaproteobacteria bacterium]
MEQLLAIISSHESFLGPAFLFLSSIVEYLFPPFPGDTVTVFGAFLVVNRNWNLALVLSCVTAGSLAGAAMDFYLGRWLAGKDRKFKIPRLLKPIIPDKSDMERFTSWFKRYGVWMILANRFLPGIRAFFFIAAGMSGMKAWVVLVLGGISALLFNILLLVAGMEIGKSFKELLSLVRGYSFVVWMIIGAIAISAVCWKLVLLVIEKRRRQKTKGL